MLLIVCDANLFSDQAFIRARRKFEIQFLEVFFSDVSVELRWRSPVTSSMRHEVASVVIRYFSPVLITKIMIFYEFLPNQNIVTDVFVCTLLTLEETESIYSKSKFILRKFEKHFGSSIILI